MKLLIFGATGVVGSWTARKAIENGHEVTLHVRDKSRVAEDIRSSSQVRIIEGTLSDEPSLSAAIRNQDAILSSLGPTGFTGFTGVFTNGYKLILRLMREHNVSRILAMSTISAYDTARDSFSLYRTFIFWVVFVLAHAVQREILGLENVFREEGEGLEWTLYRVGGLGNARDADGVAEAGWVGDGKWRQFVERREWANWMVQEAERERPMWVRKMPAIYSAKKK
ncbi:hypothetical protein AJ80_01467 [Polytolypa hystricis UAMH7299]|uniref:NAD(P)-binding domain-containing protein n=1 Tax=Polytolypa hystricis (strain UAMH7299) TaxID=1447883 RepID=A0A2B7YZW4_POLH7|nr:hypothetical protein AJ80_01467 [Polytolypa hystricis UAMH7299]